jgi:tripartite-type tricarboxylate transporter receptor subunit TctC
MDHPPNRRRRTIFRAAVLLALTALAPVASHAETYPSRLIKLIVPFPAGSATDTEARFLADKVGTALGQKIMIENKAGANGNLGATEAARATPDGYTLYLATNSTHSANVHLYASLPFDPVKDFAPVARLTRNPLVFVVNASFPAKDLKEFIAYAKANPGKLSYGTGNTGSLAAAQLVKSMAGIDAVKVPYQGTPAAITDLIGGRIEFVITDVAVTREFIAAGTLRALGVTPATPVAVLPGVPTIAAAGLPGYEFAAWSGLFAPAGTPKAIIDTINHAMVDAMTSPEAAKFFGEIGLEPDPSTPEGLAAHVKAQTELWGRIIQDAGLEKI